MSSEEEEYEFEYSEEEEEEEEADLFVEIENQYYTAKGLSDPREAQRQFEQILRLEPHQGSWGFKSLKKLIKLHFQQQQTQQMIQSYQHLLTYLNTHAVTRNVGEKGLNSILDFLSSRSQDWGVLEKFYEITLEALKQSHNDRLWFKTNVKLGHLLFEIQDYFRLQQVIKELIQACTNEDPDDSVKYDTQMLEIYALQIQMYTAQKDNKKLVAMYEKALKIKSGIAHPRIVGVIRECGGKMHMMQHKWESARSDFFEGFKSFDEAGEHRRIQCLKYLVLANMLSESKINVFDSQEAKPYENDRDVEAMTQLTDAFMHDEIQEFEKILKRNKKTIMEDAFIRHYIDNLLRTIRSKVLLKVVKPYKRLSVQYISQELNGISSSEVESLLAALILDGRIEGKIDQINGYLIILGNSKKSEQIYKSIGNWTLQLQNLHQSMLNKATTAS